MAEVLLERVSRVFPPDIRAVDEIDLEVRDGELLVLVGPSGCGKTTLLRLIAGLEPLSGGSIAIAGRQVDQLPPKDRDIAMVFQNHALYPHLSVFDNLAFGFELREGRRGGRWLKRLFGAGRSGQAASSSEIGERVRSVAKILGIESLLSRLPRELSGGQRQRVALGRAMVRKPAVFLLDEPLSNLDARLRVELRRELKLWHQQFQATTIYVTHDQAEALTLGGRVAVMNHGSVEQVAPPLELYDRPKNRFVAGFLGSPPMNFLSGELAIIEGVVNFVAGGTAIPLDRLVACRVQRYIGRRVWLGVRPEDLQPGFGRTPGAPAGRVLAVESLGDHCVVHLEMSALAATLTAKTAGRGSPAPGEVVHVEINGERAHVFDGDTGESVMWA